MGNAYDHHDEGPLKVCLANSVSLGARTLHWGDLHQDSPFWFHKRMKRNNYHAFFNIFSILSELKGWPGTCCPIDSRLVKVYQLKWGPKWGRTQMGSDRFNRILTRFDLFSPIVVRLVPLKKKISRDLNRTLTALYGICLRTA